MVHFGDALVHAAKLADLCRQYGATELSLFGSAVRGEMRPDSEVEVRPKVLSEARVIYAV